SWHAYPGGLFASWVPGPMHRACALYSAVVCPFFRVATARRKASDRDPKPMRGDAAVVGFRHYGIFFTLDAHRIYENANAWLWGYWQCVEWVPFGVSKELLPLY